MRAVRPGTDPRWGQYYLCRGAAFSTFWAERLLSEKRDLLFILGKGFDPRTSLVASAILALGGEGERRCVAIELDEGPESPSRQHSAGISANWNALTGLFENGQAIELRKIRVRDDRNRRVGSRIAGSLFGQLGSLSKYSDIVVDVSAIPRDIYFPLIGNLLQLIDENQQSGQTVKPINLHVCVAEEPMLDSKIIEQGIDDAANLIHGFGGAVDRESTTNLPRVWIPLLGENQHVQIERISELVRPDETCPALPFPARNPRRGDNLVLAYHDLLFDTLQVDPKNFLFVTEDNPFEVYRQIRTVVLHYQRVLAPLGGCKVVLSALSSKLMSIGAFLVAYEFTGAVGVAHVGSEGFIISEDGADGQWNPELFSLWVSGECYEA